MPPASAVVTRNVLDDVHMAGTWTRDERKGSTTRG
jgi:hypothetical protein